MFCYALFYSEKVCFSLQKKYFIFEENNFHM